jgi:hypothetical protein
MPAMRIIETSSDNRRILFSINCLLFLKAFRRNSGEYSAFPIQYSSKIPDRKSIKINEGHGPYVTSHALFALFFFQSRKLSKQ